MINELVTVIIPIYNVEKYLDECMQSIINQTYNNLEIIAINDGSTDNSLKIIESYKENDSRIKLVSWENRGGGACRNEGIKLAKGKYVFFMDSDDYINLNTLDILVKNISKNDDEIVVYNGIAFDNYSDKIKFHKKKYFNISNEIDRKSLLGVEFAKYGLDCMQPCIKLYNKEFIKRNNILFTEGKYGEDVEFWYKCCMLSKSIRYIDFIGYYRRYRPNSIMTGGSIRNISDRIENLGILESLVLSVDIKDRDVFTRNFEEYVFGLYYQILKRDRTEIRNLYKLFKYAGGIEIIRLSKFGYKRKIKKYICDVGVKVKVLLG